MALKRTITSLATTRILLPIATITRETITPTSTMCASPMAIFSAHRTMSTPTNLLISSRIPSACRYASKKPWLKLLSDGKTPAANLLVNPSAMPDSFVRLSLNCSAPFAASVDITLPRINASSFI